MCLFCTVVPMTISLGARSHVKYIERRKAAEARGEKPPKIISVRAMETAMTVATFGLVVGAVLYHASTASHGMA